MHMQLIQMANLKKNLSLIQLLLNMKQVKLNHPIKDNVMKNQRFIRNVPILNLNHQENVIGQFVVFGLRVMKRVLNVFKKIQIKSFNS